MAVSWHTVHGPDHRSGKAYFVRETLDQWKVYRGKWSKRAYVVKGTLYVNPRSNPFDLPGKNRIASLSKRGMKNLFDQIQK